MHKVISMGSYGGHHGRQAAPAGESASVTVPTLVLSGEKSPEQLRSAARALADVLVDAEHRVLKGQSHKPSMKVQAPVIVDFFRKPVRA